MIFNAIIKKFCVASHIKELSQITSKGRDLVIKNDFCEGVIPDNELYAIIHKFSDDHEAIKIEKETHYGLAMSSPRNYPLEFIIRILPNFERLYEDLLLDAKENQDMVEKTETKNRKDAGCWISYSENSREILLNDLFLISKPNFNSENDQVFYYLYRNPNKTITKAEFEENFNANKTLTKDFNKIVENLKFKKDLRKDYTG